MSIKLKRIVISPPFGHWLRPQWATSISGSWTVKKRSGLLLQILKTLRPAEGGWSNSIGLRNKGIGSIEKYKKDVIYSLAGFDKFDWDVFYEFIPEESMIEVNIGCPNAPTNQPSDAQFKKLLKKFSLVSLKCPPLETSQELIERYYKLGCRVFHLSNTLPTQKGGVSGKKQKEVNLPLVQWARNQYSDIYIIAGGGVYTEQDVIDYHDAGANSFSISTVFFTPWKLNKITQKIKSLPNN